MGKMLHQLVEQQSAPPVDIEEFDGNSLQYSYFRSMFREVVEKKIADPQGRLTWLIKLATGEARELVKPFIHDNLKYGYKNAMKLLERQYGDSFKLLACYRNEIKWMTKIKPGDAYAFRRLFNFLMKCQSLQFSNNQNPLDTPDMICMILSKILGFLQDRWNRHVHKIRFTKSGRIKQENMDFLIWLTILRMKWPYSVNHYFPERLLDNMKINHWNLKSKIIQSYAIKETSWNEKRET